MYACSFPLWAVDCRALAFLFDALENINSDKILNLNLICLPRESLFFHSAPSVFSHMLSLRFTSHLYAFILCFQLIFRTASISLLPYLSQAKHFLTFIYSPTQFLLQWFISLNKRLFLFHKLNTFSKSVQNLILSFRALSSKL